MEAWELPVSFSPEGGRIAFTTSLASGEWHEHFTLREATELHGLLATGLCHDERPKGGERWPIGYVRFPNRRRLHLELLPGSVRLYDDLHEAHYSYRHTELAAVDLGRAIHSLQVRQAD